MISHSEFDRTALPLARTFYEHEIGELRRPSRGWARPKAGCPFHESKSKASFAVNLDSGGFFCFSCGAHGGDVIAFFRQRYGLSFPAVLKHFHIESDYKPVPKKKEPPIPLERRLARTLAFAVEYGKDAPHVG
jgi:DNA primase